MEIVRGPSEILERRCEEIPEGEDVYWLAAGMLEAMQQGNGVGLAAPQVGEHVRLVVGGHERLGWGFTILNPEIVKTSPQTFPSEEGCLSFPGEFTTVRRHKIVVVRGFDLEWRPVKVKARGLMAAVLQHEIDHLDGVCIF